MCQANHNFPHKSLVDVHHLCSCFTALDFLVKIREQKKTDENSKRQYISKEMEIGNFLVQEILSFREVSLPSVFSSCSKLQFLP